MPNESAPGPKDSDCITWSYYSAVDTIKDTNTGLIGPLIACRKVRDETDVYDIEHTVRAMVDLAVYWATRPWEPMKEVSSKLLSNMF